MAFAWAAAGSNLAPRPVPGAGDSTSPADMGEVGLLGLVGTSQARRDGELRLRRTGPAPGITGPFAHVPFTPPGVLAFHGSPSPRMVWASFCLALVLLVAFNMR